MSPQAQELILTEFGFKDGIRIASVVVPNIVKDFEKTLSKTLAGAEVNEEYKFDDRDGSITLFGTRMADGSTKVTKIRIHGKDAAF